MGYFYPLAEGKGDKYMADELEKPATCFVFLRGIKNKRKIKQFVETKHIGL